MKVLRVLSVNQLQYLEHDPATFNSINLDFEAIKQAHACKWIGFWSHYIYNLKIAIPDKDGSIYIENNCAAIS